MSLEENAVQPVKRKFKPNEWLVDEDFLNNVHFHDLYYFRKLCDELHNFLKKIPIPALTTWDYKNKRIYCTVGTQQQWFRVSVDIPYFEFIVIMDNWLRQFYPKYSVEIEEKRAPTEEEIYQGLDSGRFKDLDEAFNAYITTSRKEIAIIERISMTSDEFKISINGKKSIRLSTKPVSVFLKELREFSKSWSQKEIRDYIFENSRYVTDVREKEGIDIPHSGNRLLNFFVVYSDSMKDIPLKPVEKLRYKWGKYFVTFESETHKKECEQLLRVHTPRMIFSD